MKRAVFSSFLKDHFLYTLSFYASAALVILFVWLQTGRQLEIAYPVILVTFVYLIFMSIRAFRYAAFHRYLERSEDHSHPTAVIQGWSEEQRHAIHTLHTAEHRYVSLLDQFEMRNAQKIDILSRMIHQIKTPTSVIDLMLQNSRDEALAPAMLDKMNKENQLVNERLNQVLAYLRLDAFQQDYRIESTDLITALRELINRQKEQFILHDVYPKWDIAEEQADVLTDRKWNSLLLEQIVSNAIKYTSVQQAAREVAFRIERDEGRVILVISDTGIGIPEHDLRRVWEPFFTGDNGRRVRSSTGIGLHIARSIAEQLNHMVTISSKQGQGTTVKIAYLTKS
ncbi:sensor histidine kinase [Paenibacillus sp. 1P07SE]|uniref:sensor histidine kinase n=1 Tax=Paenibacillus sp. 1P07SE TaxID=3132209 RepID=UPI0039A746C5